MNDKFMTVLDYVSKVAKATALATDACRKIVTLFEK